MSVSSFYSDGRGGYVKPEDEAGAKAFDAQIQAQNELNSALMKQSELAQRASNLFASTKISIPTNFGGGGVSGSSGGGGGSKGGSGGSGGADKAQREAEAEARKTEEWISKINELTSTIDISPYTEDNAKLESLASELQSVKTAQDGLTGSELADSKAKENEILQKQIDTYKHLAEIQGYEKDRIASILSNYGVLTDSTGQLTNANEKLAEAQQKANTMSGNTEDEYNAKKSAIEQVKALSDYITQYGEITNKTIPETIDKWQQLANTIKKAEEEAKKYNEEILNNAKEELAQDILKDAQEEVDRLKEQAQQAEEDAKQAMEDEKKAKLDIWDEKIKQKQAELNALNDETEDNNKKLAKLQIELSEWKKDNSTEAQGKISKINIDIDSLNKTIKKDKLSKEIDALNEQKTAESDSYDKRLSNLEKANKKQEAEDEIHYKDMLNQKKAYAKAEKMIIKGQQDDIRDLYSKYSEEYKKMGGDVSTSVDASLKKISDAITALNNLKVKDVRGGADSSGGGSSSSGGSSDPYSHNNEETTSGKTSDGITYKDTTGTYGNGTNYTISQHSGTSTNANKSYSNGDYYDSNGYYYAKSSDKYYDMASKSYKTYGSYASGGRTPSNIDNGALAILHSDEKILNAKDTIQFDSAMSKIDEMYNSIKSSGSLLGQLSQYSNIGNLAIPSLGVDLNKLANSTINNNNADNSNNINIQNTYQVDATSDFKTKTFSNNLDKQFKDTLRKFGKIKR